MRRVVLALLLAIVPIAEAQAARVDQLIEEMARRNRAQDEAERREEEADRRRARVEADAVPTQHTSARRASSAERASKPAPVSARADATRRSHSETYRSSGRGSDGCGGRGGPGWRKPNGKCASWRD